ncbi:MFS transporter [Kitasatospora sp. NPDC005856]|uniref:MFS transporter n=1 Tax=Kitasatospora sp. NPDC005856 TaxID=3154566 RepID=UPI0033CBA68B
MTTRSGPGATGDLPSAPGPRRGLALAVLAGALGLDLSGLGVLNAALPEIGEHFSLDGATLQWTMTSYALTFAGFLLFGGRAADVLGRRRVFGTGVVLFTVAALVGALAPTAGMLIVARAFQGVGAALIGPATLALLAEVFPEGPERNRAMAVYGSVGAASFSGGVVLGGVLTSTAGWRATMIFSVLFGVVVLLGVKAALPPSVRHPSPLDLPGAVLVTAGLVLAVFGVSRGGASGWGDAGTVVSLVGSVVLLVGFLVWERRSADPLMPLSLFRSVPVRISSLAALVHYSAAVGMLFFAPLYMQGVLGYSPLESGLAVVPQSIILFFVANLLTGRLLGRFGPRIPMIIGLFFIGAALVAWLFTPVDGNYWLDLLPGLLLTGIGQGLTFPSMTVGSLMGVPARQHGVAGAVNVTAQQIGSSVGVAALVVVATVSTTSDTPAGTLNGYHAAYVAGALVCLVGVLVVAAVRRGWRTDEAAAAPAVAPAVEQEGAAPATT